MKRYKRIFFLLWIGLVASILAGCSLALSPMKRSVLQQYGPPAAKYRTDQGGEVWLYRFPVLDAAQFEALARRDPDVARTGRVPLKTVRQYSTSFHEFEIEFDRRGHVRRWQALTPHQTRPAAGTGRAK